MTCGRLRHSRRHRPADRRLHLRPPRAGAAGAIRRRAHAIWRCLARYPAPTAADLAADGAGASTTCEPRAVLMVDGLAYGAMPAYADRYRCANPILALVHHPLCLEAGLGKDAAERAARLGDGRAGLGAAHCRDERHHRAQPWRPTSPSRPAGSPSPFPAPIRRPARAARERRCSCWRSARSSRARPSTPSSGRSAPLRTATGGLPSWAPPIATARRLRGAALPPSARPGSPTAHHAGRARRRGNAGRLLRRGRPLRHAVALRRLRHGACGGPGARPADRLHHRRGGGRDRSRCGGHQGRPRRRSRR